jgi:hypothetical protein
LPGARQLPRGLALPHHFNLAVERKAEAMNTNEKENTKLEIALTVEEIEAMIAPGFRWNHNETLEVELSVEELEEVIAPDTCFRFNHNETVEVDLTVEEVEEVIAPDAGYRWNHNETLLLG